MCLLSSVLASMVCLFPVFTGFMSRIYEILGCLLHSVFSFRFLIDSFGLYSGLLLCLVLGCFLVVLIFSFLFFLLDPLYFFLFFCSFFFFY